MALNWQINHVAMKAFNLTSVVLIVLAAGICGIGVHLSEQKEIQRLRAENQELLAQQQALLAEQQATKAASDAQAATANQVDVDRAELMRLRNEVAQFRRERDLQKSTPTNAPPQSPYGAYIKKDQLTFLGYATPESTLQSMWWAFLNGTYDLANQSLSPQLLARQLRDEKGQEKFENSRKLSGPMFKGMQILGKKTISESNVEMKIRIDSAQAPNTGVALPKSPIQIQPMIKIGDAWKLSGSIRQYQPEWDQEGQVEIYSR